MKRINPIIFPAITLLMAAGLIRLRDWQLETGFDAQGIPVGGATTWLVLGLTAVAALLWLLLSWAPVSRAQESCARAPPPLAHV